MSTDLATRGAASDLVLADEQTDWTDKQRYALGFGKNVTNADAAIYLHVCKRTGLDPFARQIYMIERWTKDGARQTIQTGIDGYRLVAQRTIERTHGTLGYDDTKWCGPDGVWHDVWLGSEAPAAAKVVVFRNGQPFPAVALFTEYVQTYKDKSSGQMLPTAMWKDRAAGQLAKCAEALALRKAFPQDLSGLFTDDEMGQADRQPPVATKATGLDAVRAAVGQTAPESTEEIIDGVVVDETTGEVTPAEPVVPGITSTQSKALHASFRDVGIDDREQRLAYCNNLIQHNVTTSSDLTKAEASLILDALRADKAERDGAADPWAGGEQA